MSALSAEFWVLSVECCVPSTKCWLLKSTAVIGYQVFLLQVVCQERKPKIYGLFLSVVHILGQNLHWYSPKTEAGF